MFSFIILEVGNVNIFSQKKSSKVKYCDASVCLRL